MKVLFAADASPYVLQNASLLRRCLPSGRPIQVDLTTVVTPGAELPREWRRDRSQIWGEAASWSDGVERILEGPGVTLRRTVLTGGAAEILVRASTSYDLVVAGVKGEGATDFVQLGTVARALLRHSEASVLLVRSNGSGFDAPGGVEARTPLRVLYPTDGSPEGAAAGWEWLRDLAGSGAEIDLLPVSDPESTGEDRPAIVIGRRAQAGGADLIVLGGRGSGPGAPAPLDTLDRELAWRGPCSVLMLRRASWAPQLRVRRVSGAPDPVNYRTSDAETPAWTSGTSHRS